MMQLQHQRSQLSQAGIVAGQHTFKNNHRPTELLLYLDIAKPGQLMASCNAYRAASHHTHTLLTWHTVADSWVGQHGLQDTISSRLNDVGPG